MQLEEAESQLQASEGEQRCDQDGCFYYADAALPVRTGCYIARTAECASTGCCFEGLVVIAELRRDGSGAMTCRVAIPLPWHEMGKTMLAAHFRLHSQHRVLLTLSQLPLTLERFATLTCTAVALSMVPRYPSERQAQATTFCLLQSISLLRTWLCRLHAHQRRSLMLRP